MIGDNGRARGFYQFHSRTWQHVSDMRKKEGLSRTDWKTGSMNLQWSTLYAETYVDWLRAQLLRKLGWYSERTVYAAWNIGLSKVVAVNGDLSKVNDTTREKCSRLSSNRHTSR